ncbi:MAG: hypothetical protein HQ592_02230 [Planctomycetes bacterium]|nr:hypothetical protein [Planctomycetota bacterium]
MGDVNGDGNGNWVDAGVICRDGNFPRSQMIDRSPGLCDNFNQTRVSHNWGYMLWSTPYIGNTHSDTRAHKHGRDGRPSHEWGGFSRSIPYETASGRMARYFDKQADEFNFPPMPAFIGADTWTCGLGGGDGTAGHLATGEEGTQAKIYVLKMLARRGYLTHSEALSGWGLDGGYFFGWWTPYFGGGAWLAGFSRCWEYSPTAPSGPRRAYLFGKPVPLQAVIFQGMVYYGTGARGPVGYSILHGCMPGAEGSPAMRNDESFFYPWMVLWKIISPRRVMNAREPEDELWEMTYDDGSVLKLDVRANVWAYTKDGITYDGYSPPNPPNGAIKPKPPFTWGMRWGNYGERFAEGSFGVWRNGTFTIKVPGVRAVKPPRVVGASDKDQAPPAYQANYDGRVLTITIKDKDPIDHPMLVFEPAGELKE